MLPKRVEIIEVANTLSRQQHVGKRTGHREPAIVDGVVEHERKGAVGMLRAQLRHRPLRIAGDHQMPDLAPLLERALEKSALLPDSPRSGKRKSRNIRVRRDGSHQTRSAAWCWARPTHHIPAAAQKRGERPSGVVRRTRADEIDGRRGGTSPANSGAPQDVRQCRSGWPPHRPGRWSSTCRAAARFPGEYARARAQPSPARVIPKACTGDSPT